MVSHHRILSRQSFVDFLRPHGLHSFLFWFHAFCDLPFRPHADPVFTTSALYFIMPLILHRLCNIATFFRLLVIRAITDNLTRTSHL